MKRFAFFLLVLAFCVPAFGAQTIEAITNSSGNSINHTPSVAVAAGEIVTLGTTKKFPGISATAIAANAGGALMIEGVFKIKKGAIVFVVGDDVEWNEAGSTAQVGGAGTLVLGTCVKAAASGDDFVLCKLGGAGSSTGVARSSPVQTIDMADVAVTLTLVPGTPTGTLVTSNVLYVDANSAGTENLLLPPEADMSGVTLIIVNTGGESIILQSDSGGALLTLETLNTAVVTCDGTTLRGFVGLP